MSDFELMLFSTDPGLVRHAVAAGVTAIMVDWESLGKRRRQRGADTQITEGTPEDLRRVRDATDRLVVCRINQRGATTPSEVEAAVSAGADEILLPMVRSCEEVEAVRRQIAGRCGLGILVETLDAVARADELARLPLTRAYVGLNDLSIERRTPSIFSSVADGTVESVSRAFAGVPFGFAGVTLAERGSPIPCRLLMGEMARLGCSFAFLRRSFLADVRGKELAREIPRILDAMAAAFARTPRQVDEDRSSLHEAIAACGG